MLIDSVCDRFDFSVNAFYIYLYIDVKCKRERIVPRRTICRL